jgi:hypothetical protein
MLEIIAYPLGLRAVGLRAGRSQVGLDEVGEVRRIQQRGLNEDAGAKRVVPEIGINYVPVKDEAQDLQFYHRAGRQRDREERGDTGIRDILNLPNPLGAVFQLGDANGQISGNALIEPAIHGLAWSTYRRNAGTTLGLEALGIYSVLCGSG